MSRCTCETTGWCTACRTPIDYDLPPQRILSGRELIKHDLDPRIAGMGVKRCVWCKQVYRMDTMFRFGKNRWDKWVCGPRCLLRPGYGKIWKGRERSKEMTQSLRRGQPMRGDTRERTKMTASKKLYEKLAYDLVREARSAMSFDRYEALVNRIGKSLEEDNPNFDWVMWLEATGIVKKEAR